MIKFEVCTMHKMLFFFFQLEIHVSTLRVDVTYTQSFLSTSTRITQHYDVVPSFTVTVITLMVLVCVCKV